ncbi:MAG: serine O-acetyltransferase [Sneathiella sp.]|jgi:serine O-acetyltransferase|uniref:serine O-acetyltransferase EpsC n=1 Tax=Sneathiella sp. TaxID=1964365 RepID=UPI000C655717|nr:serine O-acetyltransferase EpsC [Sneathiella sp.]MAL79914.1 serine O-acetyltransferase [Sneathiella sp.]|tara:strand:+ start:495 stop:1259 length:765 start_codon:yes stop_codon:yes gene_type:complete
MFKHISEEITCVMERDPAARSRLEVALLYQGFHAVILHRAAHWLWQRKWRLLARLLSQLGRFLTGIEIHPGAVIGRKFFIDHGMGVVIGETAEIGDNVTLYHDVTLGGVAPSIDSDKQRGVKRHPTLQDNVIIASGAQIIGPITVGKCARVGANSVVLKDVPEGTTVVGIPARAVNGSRPATPDARFAAYGVGNHDLPDPVFKVMDGLLDKVQSLSMRVEELENERRVATDSPIRLPSSKKPAAPHSDKTKPEQ